MGVRVSFVPAGIVSQNPQKQIRGRGLYFYGERERVLAGLAGQLKSPTARWGLVLFYRQSGQFAQRTHQPGNGFVCGAVFFRIFDTFERVIFNQQ